MGEIFTSPNGELQAVLQIKEGDGTMLKLRADDACVGKPSPSR